MDMEPSAQCDALYQPSVHLSQARLSGMRSAITPISQPRSQALRGSGQHPDAFLLKAVPSWGPALGPWPPEEQPGLLLWPQSCAC